MEVPFLKNIKLEYLTNGDIISLAQYLGCDYEEPVMKINKYIMDYPEHEKEFEEEQEKNSKEYNMKFDKYMDDVIDWLYNHNYLEDKDDS